MRVFSRSISRVLGWFGLALIAVMLAGCPDDDSSTAAAGGGGTGGGGGGTATSSGTVTAPLTALAGTQTYVLAYAGTVIGIDTRPATATFTSANALSSYRYSGSESLAIGSNSAAEIAGDADVNIGRWNGGTLGGNYYSTTPWAISGNQGFHYALGTRPNKLACSGVSTYTLASATKVTQGDGAVTPGMLNNMKITATFAASGTPTLDLAMDYTLNGAAGSFNKTGVVSAPFIGFNTILESGGGSGPSTILDMAFAGPNREKMIFAYHRYTTTGGSASSVSISGYMTRSTDSSADCP